ncbi:hypothetical protein SAMN04515648_0095 [Phyllobacterium sp. CL33Tsu]|nr:hypothetical protein SAMN04515648_0095 [Phyllobacterium sp. CL33Tsu]
MIREAFVVPVLMNWRKRDSSTSSWHRLSLWTARGPISGPIIAASQIRLSVRATLSRRIGRTFFHSEAKGSVHCSIYQVCQHAEMFVGGFGLLWHPK